MTTPRRMGLGASGFGFRASARLRAQLYVLRLGCSPLYEQSIIALLQSLGPGVGPYFLLLGLGFPYNPLKTTKGTLFSPRLLLGLDPSSELSV